MTLPLGFSTEVYIHFPHAFYFNMNQITFLPAPPNSKSAQFSPVCPSEKSNMYTKMNMEQW